MSFAIKIVETPERLKEVFSFATAILGPIEEPHTLERYLEQLVNAGQLLVYAVKDGRICGCILASVDGDHILVGPVAVAENARRLGIGSAMMAKIETEAKNMGQTTLILGAREQAEPFYLSCGFQPNLFIQVPRPNLLGELKSLNRTYEIAWKMEQESESKLMLRTPVIDKPLQHQYDQSFPDCSTQYVFIKKI